MFKFVQLTDSHLIQEGSLFGVDPDARLKAAVDSINIHHGDAAFCVMTGDLTHLGEPAAFGKVRAHLERLRMPVYPIPGNHDLRDAFASAFPEVPRTQGGFFQYGIDVETGSGAAARFLMLDTLEEGTSVGRLCAARLAWVRKELNAAVGRSVYVFMHHAPLQVGIDGMDEIRLEDGEALHRLLAEHGDVRHVFFGHLHRSCSGSWRGIPFSTHRATVYQVALDLTPGAPLSGSAENPEYAIILINGEDVIVHRHSYLEEGKAFSYQRPPHLSATEGLN